MTDLTNLIDFLDDFILKKIAEVLPSPLNASLRGISARFMRAIEPPKRMRARDLRDLGVQTGCILMLKVALANSRSWSIWTCAVAASYGRIDVLAWLHDNGCPWDENTCAMAADGGHLEMLKWLHTCGCPWDESTCVCAAVWRHLDCLKYAHEHGCPWNTVVCLIARAHGDLECLEYALANGCSDDRSSARHHRR